MAALDRPRKPRTSSPTSSGGRCPNGGMRATATMATTDKEHYVTRLRHCWPGLFGALSLFGAWFLGGYVGAAIPSKSPLVGYSEPLAGKIACSVAILLAAVVLRRYLLRSFGLAVLCLLATEVVVFLIITAFSGLTTLTDIGFNAETLYQLTWNVVIAFLIGAAAGQSWDNRAATKAAGMDHGPAAP